MERLCCLPTESACTVRDKVAEWIPTQQDVIKAYNNLSPTRQNVKKQAKVRDIVPKSRKIGKRTFVEGCFDAVLLLACRAGNVPVVSYLLTIYLQFFSIDTLIDRLSAYFGCIDHPFLYGSKRLARFKQLQCDKISLLHAAVEGLQLDVIKLLLSAGANVNIPSKWSITPLISALMRAHRRSVHGQTMVTCLIDSGANVNCRDADGMTPLMYAALRNCGNFVQMLITAGANPYQMDNEGFTALHHACVEKSSAVIKHLLKIAPDLLLVRGKLSLACPAPYMAFLDMFDMFV